MLGQAGGVATTPPSVAPHQDADLPCGAACAAAPARRARLRACERTWTRLVDFRAGVSRAVAREVGAMPDLDALRDAGGLPDWRIDGLPLPAYLASEAASMYQLCAQGQVLCGQQTHRADRAGLRDAAQACLVRIVHGLRAAAIAQETSKRLESPAAQSGPGAGLAARIDAEYERLCMALMDGLAQAAARAVHAPPSASGVPCAPPLPGVTQLLDCFRYVSGDSGCGVRGRKSLLVQRHFETLERCARRRCIAADEARLQPRLQAGTQPPAARSPAVMTAGAVPDGTSRGPATASVAEGDARPPVTGATAPRPAGRKGWMRWLSWWPSIRG